FAFRLDVQAPKSSGDVPDIDPARGKVVAPLPRRPHFYAAGALGVAGLEQAYALVVAIVRQSGVDRSRRAARTQHRILEPDFNVRRPPGDVEHVERIAQAVVDLGISHVRAQTRTADGRLPPCIEIAQIAVGAHHAQVDLVAQAGQIVKLHDKPRPMFSGVIVAEIIEHDPALKQAFLFHLHKQFHRPGSLARAQGRPYFYAGVVGKQQ